MAPGRRPQGYAFGFTGREHDADTGLIYSRQRYYDPGVGVWLSPDRKKMVNGPNLYQYVLDNPTRYTDPSGNVVVVDDALLGLFLLAAFIIIYVDLLELQSGITFTPSNSGLSCQPTFANKGDPLTQRPRDAPTGTVPIDEFPDLDREAARWPRRGGRGWGGTRPFTWWARGGRGPTTPVARSRRVRCLGTS